MSAREFTDPKREMTTFRIGCDTKQSKGLTVRQLFLRFYSNESGATAIEYGLIAAGIAVAIIAVVTGVGSQLNTTFTSVSSSLK